jgi:hypothetical protein
MKLVNFFPILASASAFVPPSQTKGSFKTVLHETKADLRALAERSNPTLGYYDPLVSFFVAGEIARR